MVDVPSGIGTTAQLIVGQTIRDRLEFLGDSDWYRMTLVAGSTYAFAMTGAAVAGASFGVADTLISIHNASGSLLDENDDGSFGYNSLLNFTAPYSGTYYVNATSYEGDYTGGYEIVSTLIAAAPVDDLPGDPTTTRLLPVGGSVDAVINFTFDEDAVFIDLLAGRTYVFEGLGAASGIGLTLLDPYIVVAGPNGIIVADDDDNGAGLNARLTFTPTQTGRHFVGAFDISGGTGSYRLTAAEILVFNGGSGADALYGTPGNDTIYGLGGDDTLHGVENAFDRSGGDDWLYGGTGNDFYRVDGQRDVIVEFAGEGIDGVATAASYYLYAEIENLNLNLGAGDIFGVGNALDNTIGGNEGNNLIIGGGGNDFIYGRAGNDALFGEAGNDRLIGGAGIDYIVGGDGNDGLQGEADPDALYGGAGDDQLFGGGDFSTDILVGGDGNDILDGSDGFANLGDFDLMDGGGGNDTYAVDTPADLTFEAPGGGIDTVQAKIVGAGYYLYANVENLYLVGATPFGVGNELDNFLLGSNESNYLLGGAGNDSIDGSRGNDVLFGEAGADIFVFERGTGGDVIGDFAPGIDKIALRGLGFVDFAQLRAAFVEVAGTSAINLGQGDFIVLNGVANAQLSAADFIIA